MLDFWGRGFAPCVPDDREHEWLIPQNRAGILEFWN
jgi:hypothetical protein